MPELNGVRKFTRFNERPIALPDNILYQIGEAPFVRLTGLLDPTQYANKVLYAASHDYWAEQSIESIVFNDDKHYTRTLFDEIEHGEYQNFIDGQVILRTEESRITHNYGFLMESNDVVIGAYIGLPWPHFNNEADAKIYASNVVSSSPVSTIEHLLNREIYMVDRDLSATWVVSYIKFSEGSAFIYEDGNFTDIKTELQYSIDESGMISFLDNENTMYLSLVTDSFNIMVTNDAENRSKDFNYILFDYQKAHDFVRNTNALRQSSGR